MNSPNTERGTFPNFEFLRALKKSLENDEGTIFRYSNHENTILNLIYHQLEVSEEEITDKHDLLDFVRTITKSTSDSKESWIGNRNMVDMWDLVKRYYYDPATNGSNSIKQVLPAIMGSSTYLQEKYSQPIYGVEGNIESLNFTDWQWIQFEDGKVKDPYSLLPKMFQDMDEDDFDLLSEANELKDGGAALTAYAKCSLLRCLTTSVRKSAKRS